MGLVRQTHLDPEQSALLFIDVQNFCVRRDGGEFAALSEVEIDAQCGWYFDQLDRVVIPNMQQLQRASRRAKIEVLYTTIESLTIDGRDRSLDYKRNGLLVPRGSWDGQVIDKLAPCEDEILLPKSSSSVFVSTSINYVLRNLGVKQLVIAGVVTDQCVESAIRDACDLGYLVTQVTDACAARTRERHENSLKSSKNYCRQVTTETLLRELESVAA